MVSVLTIPPSAKPNRIKMFMHKERVQRQFEGAFGTPIEKMSVFQLQFIIDCGRHIRANCSSNADLIDWIEDVFPGARAEMIPVKDVLKPGKTFEALEIKKV